MKKTIKILVSTAMWVLPTIALAARGVDVNGNPILPTLSTDVYDTINAIVNWMFLILLLGAVVVVIIAAFNFLTAAGDAEKTKKARDYITYALVAIVVGFLAKAIVILIGSVLGIQTTIIK